MVTHTHTDSFDDLYRRHRPRVYGYCRRILGCPEDAADATQQAFLNVHRRLAGGSEIDNVGGYLLRAAQRASFEVHHRRRRQQALQERDELRRPEALAAPDHAAAVVTAHAVRAAAGELPERYRSVLVMREVEDMTYEQIAERLDLKANAVAQLLHRARKRLADELALAA